MSRCLIGARRIGVFVLVLGLSSSAALAFTPSGKLEIHYVNVQQGGSTLVIGPDGTTILMDAGNTGKGSTEIVPYLNSLGLLPIDGLDYTLGGHLDSDHIGGFAELFDAGYDVRFANWYNGSSKSNQTIDRYKSSASQTTAGAPVAVSVGQTIDLGGGATATVIAAAGNVIGHGPVAGAINENDLSVAVLIEYGNFDFIWASDLGGGQDDNACTGRATSQINIETPLAQAITPGGIWPLLSAAGVDVLHVNHHGSESSTNSDWMNLLKPTVAVISVGAGQGGNWHHPRKDVVENVLLARATCITASAAYVLQTEEGAPTGAGTSFAGYAVGDIKITTDGATDYQIFASGAVSQGPDERVAAGLPGSFGLDEAGANLTPTASFTHSCTELTCVFTDMSTDPDGTVTGWSWDFGDGAISTAVNPIHDYAAGGNYTVALTVTDDAGATGSTTALITVAGPGTVVPGTVLLSEVFYDASGADNGLEWVELYNSGTAAVDLSGYSLGNGGSAYTYSKAQLSGSIGPGAAFVVGGATASATNGGPVFDLVLNFAPDFQNSGTTADGVALFDVPAAQVGAATVPVDAVVYGGSNNNGLIDETGSANPPEVGDAPAGSSIERIDLIGSWQIQSAPSPNVTPLPLP